MENLHRTKTNEVQQYAEPIRLATEKGDQATLKRLRRDQERAVKLQKMDKEELQRLHAAQRTFLRKAVENFLKCFAACSDFDQYVPKFCAIWLKHAKQRGLNDIVSGILPQVPSYKFLLLLHQLCSRLSEDKHDVFQQCLTTLLLRIINEHPFHASHQIFSAIFGSREALGESRSSAARALAGHASQTRKIGQSSIRELFTTLFDMYSAYSDLANLPIDKRSHAGNEIPISSCPGLRKFRAKSFADLRLPPPSLKIPISPDLDYSTLPFIKKYHHSFRIAGGINQPKILDSVLSNGALFRELVSPA